MYDYIYRIYAAIVENTSSDLILFFVILALAVTPAYVFIFKDRKSVRKHESEKQDKENERNKEIITIIKEMSGSNNNMAKEFSAVVAENTGVITTLKELIKNHDAELKNLFQYHGAESKLANARIHEKIEQFTVRLHERMDNIKVDTSIIKTEIVAIRADTTAIKEFLKMMESWWKK